MLRSIICLLLAVAAVSAQEDNGDGFYQGDVILTSEQEATLIANSNPQDPFSPQNAVVRNSRSLWPGGIIPYVFDPSLSNEAVDAIQRAMTTYRTMTCIDFVQRTNQQDYVRFFRGNGCFSFIGRIGGPQDISIGRNCHFEGIVIHEIFHALGRWHEQSRPDRDQFVRIISGNIQPGTEGNFEITNPSFVTTQGVPYDLRSIMHYSSRAFSTNGQPTILPVDPSVSERDLGQRQGFTNLDLQHVRTLYNCEGGSNGGTWSEWTGFSSCSRTCNGGTRTRTRTCVGGADCEGSSINTQVCNTNSCPDPSTWGSWSTWSGCSRSCGGGFRRRFRSCVGGENCIGERTQFDPCNTDSCPQPATWGSWGSWSSCSSTCQGGERLRRRTCQNGNNCPGTDVEEEDCNTNTPCVMPPDPNSGEWSSWSPCSKDCGGGVRFRSRMCNADECVTETEACNTDECNPEPRLRGIRHRGCWYLNTRTRRLGTLEGRSPDLSDNPFTRVNAVSKCGLQAQTEPFKYFGISLGYCISGSNLLSDYQYYPSRLCRDGRGGYNRGFFIMDVYEIDDPQSFADSAVVDELAATTDDSSSGQKMAYSMAALLICTLTGLLYLLH